MTPISSRNSRMCLKLYYFSKSQNLDNRKFRFCLEKTRADKSLEWVLQFWNCGLWDQSFQKHEIDFWTFPIQWKETIQSYCWVSVKGTHPVPIPSQWIQHILSINICLVNLCNWSWHFARTIGRDSFNARCMRKSLTCFFCLTVLDSSWFAKVSSGTADNWIGRVRFENVGRICLEIQIAICSGKCRCAVLKKTFEKFVDVLSDEKEDCAGQR